jgi:membrane associated rhomboid family serine protease
MIFPIGDDNIKGGFFPLFSYFFLFMNVVVFIYQIQLNELELFSFIENFGAIPIKTFNGVGYSNVLTSMFLHGGLIHLIGNMLFLLIFADNIEGTIGNWWFLGFYILGGISAYLFHFLLNPFSEIPLVGASGAISAVMGSYLIMFPKSRIKLFFFFMTFRIPAYIFLLVWIFHQWLESSNYDVERGGIAYYAHIGGFLYGIIAGFVFRKWIPEENLD